jgi:hypothetical protein
MEKIKLVVFNNHTLGYITPELKDYVQVLHTSVLKGYHTTVHPSSFYITKLDTVRLASPNDFDDFRVCFNGFNNINEYEYVNN